MRQDKRENWQATWTLSDWKLGRLSDCTRDCLIIRGDVLWNFESTRYLNRYVLHVEIRLKLSAILSVKIFEGEAAAQKSLQDWKPGGILFFSLLQWLMYAVHTDSVLSMGPFIQHQRWETTCRSKQIWLLLLFLYWYLKIVYADCICPLCDGVKCDSEWSVNLWLSFSSNLMLYTTKAV